MDRPDSLQRASFRGVSYNIELRVEHCLRNAEVEGSIPFCSTTFAKTHQALARLLRTCSSWFSISEWPTQAGLRTEVHTG